MANNIFSNDDFESTADNHATSDNTDFWSMGEDSDFDFESIHTETVDIDMDGIDDSIIEEIDLDGDGFADIVNVSSDTDGDGYIDTTAEVQDFNYDGIVDSLTILHDANGDGIIDYSESQIDVDSDGTVDFAIMEEDVNYDGIADNTEVMATADDGSGDVYFMRAADLDLDGEIDSFEITKEDNPFSMDDDGYPDEETFNEDIPDYPEVTPIVHPDDYEVPVMPDSPDDFDGFDDGEDDDIDNIDGIDEDDDSAPYIDLEELGYDESNNNSLFSNELGNYDPATADPDHIIGNPDDVLDLWECQGSTSRCALYAQKFVIEEYTGEEVDIEELVDLAKDNGWFVEGSGTPVVYMDKILDYYDIPNETSFGNDINDIVESISEGHKVIVSVDADEYWYGENENVYIPGDGINHAVEIIGIDNSDPSNPLIILNDSGSPDGCGSLIPLETFMDAWEDGGCFMIECM